MKKYADQSFSSLQHHYNVIQADAKIGYWVWDINNGTLSWSDQIYTIFDINPSDFSPSYEFFLQKVHPEDRTSVEKAVNNALYRHENYSINHRILRSDNSVHTVHEHGTVLFDENGQAYQMHGTVQDISDLCELNRELTLYQERLAYLQEHSPVLLIAGKIYKSLQINYCSNNLLKIFGYTYEDLCNESASFEALIHPKDHYRLVALINEFQHARKADAFLRIRHHNGGYLYCHITLNSDHKFPGSFIGYIENFNDSYIARSEADLLKSLISDITDAIFILDAASGNILDVNTQACKATGYRRSELCSMNVVDIEKRLTTPAMWNEHLSRLRKERKMLFEGEHLRKDGSTFPVEINLTYIETDHPYIAAVARDITERKATEQQLQAYQEGLEHLIMQRTKELNDANSKLQNYIQTVDKNILTSSTDLNGKITYVSDAFCAKTGYTKEELLGKSHNIFKHPDTPPSVYKELWKTITSGKIWQHELKMRNKNGHTFWMDVTVEPVFDEHGELRGYTAIRHDITYQKQVEKLSITDPLTGLYNRRHLYEVFPRELRRAKRYDLCINFLMIDIDFFKQYNDSYGHKKGDEALTTIGALLKRSLKRVDDYAFRLGGEEFGIIFVSDDFTQARRFCEELLHATHKLAIPHRSSTVAKELTLSMGLVSSYIESIPEWETIYEMADKALYQVKESGRNNLFITTFI